MIKTVILIQIGLLIVCKILSKLKNIRLVSKRSLKKKIDNTVRLLILTLIPFLGLIFLSIVTFIMLFWEDDRIVDLLNNGKEKFEVVE